MGPVPVAITRERFDAVLFDMDGVLTATAKVHAVCWKKLFDEYLKKREVEEGEPFQAFEIATDYLQYVDGKPRVDGVRDFLKSRGIELPEGDRDSAPGSPTVHGLGNRKNEMINKVIESEGVEAYEGSVALVRRLRQQGIKTAVVTSSHNCDAVLRAAKIGDLFDEKVDGGVAVERKLRGKPAPDTYLAAAQLLGAEASRSVVVEDAISGVQAGRAGDFGLVIGVAREDNAAALKENGADTVVTDLSELLE